MDRVRRFARLVRIRCANVSKLLFYRKVYGPRMSTEEIAVVWILALGIGNPATATRKWIMEALKSSRKWRIQPFYLSTFNLYVYTY